MASKSIGFDYDDEYYGTYDDFDLSEIDTTLMKRGDYMKVFINSMIINPYIYFFNGTNLIKSPCFIKNNYQLPLELNDLPLDFFTDCQLDDYIYLTFDVDKFIKDFFVSTLNIQHNNNDLNDIHPVQSSTYYITLLDICHIIGKLYLEDKDQYHKAFIDYMKDIRNFKKLYKVINQSILVANYFKLWTDDYWCNGDLSIYCHSDEMRCELLLLLKRKNYSLKEGDGIYLQFETYRFGGIMFYHQDKIIMPSYIGDYESIPNLFSSYGLNFFQHTPIYNHKFK